jgi:hypothetical protein
LLGYRRAADSGRYQLAYFAGYAMWTYLTEPASLILPGVVTEEIDPWTRPIPFDPPVIRTRFGGTSGSFREWPDSVGACA